MNSSPELVEIPLDDVPWLHGQRFYRLSAPAFLDHAGDAHCVEGQRFTAADGLALFQHDPLKTIYLFKAYRDVRDGTHVLRLTVCDRHPEAKLITHVGVWLDLQSVAGPPHSPTHIVNLRLDRAAVTDIQSCWGRDEVARMLGDQLLTQLDATTTRLPGG